MYQNQMSAAAAQQAYQNQGSYQGNQLSPSVDCTLSAGRNTAMADLLGDLRALTKRATGLSQGLDGMADRAGIPQTPQNETCEAIQEPVSSMLSDFRGTLINLQRQISRAEAAFQRMEEFI